MFTDAPYSAAETGSAAIISFPRKRKSLFARVLDALHHSRRIQARHVVRRYHHLISYGDRLESVRSDDLDR